MRDDPVVLTGVAILITAGIFLAYPIIMWTVLGIGMVWCIGRHLDKRLTARTQCDRELRVHADHEHQLVMQGDPAGMYGMFPPEDLATR